MRESVWVRYYPCPMSLLPWHTENFALLKFRIVVFCFLSTFIFIFVHWCRAISVKSMSVCQSLSMSVFCDVRIPCVSLHMACRCRFSVIVADAVVVVVAVNPSSSFNRICCCCCFALRLSLPSEHFDFYI